MLYVTSYNHMTNLIPLSFSVLVKMLVKVFFCWLLILCYYYVEGGNVTYDRRSLIINGQRKLLISGSIHYPRSVPEMWPGLIQTAKEGGVDVIDTYVFWNIHEISQNELNFKGRYDLVKFVKTVEEAGLYLILRIGPYICSEWNYGGIPVWLHYVPGTVFRTDCDPFKHYMQKWMTYIVNLMKQENLFASQGGPIILAQVENEYGGYEPNYGEAGKRYAKWASQMALSLNTGVPWIMCNQYDVYDPVTTTCNSFYCDNFSPTSLTCPKLWTENWSGWFQKFWDPTRHRPSEDIAFSVARFFQKGGSLQNYYMYHGGTNFGRSAGGPFVTTTYDYDAPIDEYGLMRQPKWAHLRDLHKAIKLCEHVLLNGENTLVKLGPLQEADVFEDSSGGCAAFLANTDNTTDKVVQFRNSSYNLPAWSVSILPDCKNVVFNTAKVDYNTSKVEMIPEKLRLSTTFPNKGLNASKWEVFVEKTGLLGKADFAQIGLVDQIYTTRDTTDYLWYTTSVNIKENDQILKDCQPLLIVESKGHYLHAFVNQKLEASTMSSNSKTPITLKAGENEIAILSMTMGLQHGAERFYEWIGAGLTSVRIEGCTNKTIDLSMYTWTYKIGLEGEKLGIYKPDNFSNLKWVANSKIPKRQPLTWYKAIVDAPPGNDPIGLDMIHMGKGFAWLNGEGIGRYLLMNSSKDQENCVDICDYRGKFSYDKCFMRCGEITQRWYHVPRSWFKPTGNVLVIFEEIGGDPTQIKFCRRKISAYVRDYRIKGSREDKLDSTFSF